MPQGVIAYRPGVLHGTAAATRPADMREVPADRTKQFEGLLEASTERQEQQTHQRQKDAERDHPQQRDPGVVLENPAECDPILFAAFTSIRHGVAVTVRRAMLHPRTRRHQDLPARDPCAPAQIDIVETESRVVETELVPHVAGDQHRASVNGEHFEHTIELTLIDLLGLQRRHRVSEAIHRTADVAKLPRAFEIDHLRTDDPDTLGARKRGRLHEVGHRIGVEHRVAVQQQDVVGHRGHRQGQCLCEGADVAERLVVTDHPLCA